MTRSVDSNILFTGTEPVFSKELSKIDLMKSLSWYSQNKELKDSLKYSCDYFKKVLKIDAVEVLKNRSTTFGFVCRIISNGGSLPAENKIWFNEQVQKVKNELETQLKLETEKIVVNVNTVNIQDRIRYKADECIAELESQFDDFILSDCKDNVSPYSIFNKNNLKDVQVKYIVDWAKSKRREFTNVINTKDLLLEEGYSNFSKNQLKKIVDYFDLVILDCQKLSETSSKIRKPRKRKKKTPEQLVSKLKYMDNFPDMKLKSVKPTDIIGNMSLWVYNTKTRKLGVYHSEDAGGLSVKGSTIINYSESKSVQKKLRKPEVLLPEVLNGGKVFLRNVLDNIRAVESTLTGRINSDIILLRIM